MGENNINGNFKTFLSGPFTPSITATFKGFILNSNCMTFS